MDTINKQKEILVMEDALDVAGRREDWSETLPAPEILTFPVSDPEVMLTFGRGADGLWYRLGSPVPTLFRAVQVIGLGCDEDRASARVYLTPDGTLVYGIEVGREHELPGGSLRQGWETVRTASGKLDVRQDSGLFAARYERRLGECGLYADMPEHFFLNVIVSAWCLHHPQDGGINPVTDEAARICQDYCVQTAERSVDGEHVLTVRMPLAACLQAAGVDEEGWDRTVERLAMGLLEHGILLSFQISGYGRFGIFAGVVQRDFSKWHPCQHT